MRRAGSGVRPGAGVGGRSRAGASGGVGESRGRAGSAVEPGFVSGGAGLGQRRGRAGTVPGPVNAGAGQGQRRGRAPEGSGRAGAVLLLPRHLQPALSRELGLGGRSFREEGT